MRKMTRRSPEPEFRCEKCQRPLTASTAATVRIEGDGKRSAICGGCVRSEAGYRDRSDVPGWKARIEYK